MLRVFCVEAEGRVEEEDDVLVVRSKCENNKGPDDRFFRSAER